jgi:hypothetical protein
LWVEDQEIKFFVCCDQLMVISIFMGKAMLSNDKIGDFFNIDYSEAHIAF